MRLLLSLALLLPLAAWAGDGPSTDEDLKAALRSVLAHGDLSDLPHLSDTLGLGLRVAKPDLRNRFIDPSTHFRAIATKNPRSLLASSLSYEARFSTRLQSSHLTLEFSPRSCPRLVDWGKDWNIRVNRTFDPHGAGENQELQWPGPEGITLSIFYFYRWGGGCSARLVQIVDKRVHFSPPESVPPNADGLSIQQIVDLLAARDLRDYAWVASTLHTELIPLPKATQAGLLYSGRVDLARVIPGVDPWRSTYYGDDTGWVAPPSLHGVPRQLAERDVHLELMIDYESTCLSPADLDSEVRRRATNVSTERPDEKRTRYSVTGDNLIELSVASEGGCVRELWYHQITAVEHSVKTPMMFPVHASLDAVSGSLTGAATAKIDAIMKHVNDLDRVPLKRIDILQCRAGVASAPEGEAALLLAELVKNAFTENGIPPERITLRATVESIHSIDCVGRVKGERDGSGAAFVVVNVLID